MVGSVIPVQRFTTMPGHFKHLTQKPTSRRWCKKSSVAKCSKRDVDEERWSIGVNKKRNHYEVLGVSVDSTSKEIKEAYRKLQKRYHPDIAGQKGHELSLMLNKAYKVLMREELRHDYDASIGQPRVSIGGKKSDLGYSSWNGPFRPEALFVDESACIGCRECIHHASNTFTMDEALGCARVKLQYGDDDTNIEVSVESCPVNCIHWVNRDDLPVLEFLTRPQPKNGHGIFGQGWERPKNVFMAVEAFKKQLQQEEEEEEASYHHRNARKTAEEETPAQAEARVNASMKLQMERFSGVWSWVNEILGH